MKTKKKLSSGAKPKLSLESEKKIADKIMSLRQAKIPVTCLMLKVFGLQQAQEDRISGFKASEGWVSNFKRRWNLTLRKGTKRCPKISSSLKGELHQMQKDVYDKILLEGYDYMINIDETPIYFNMTYDRTLANSGDHEVLIAKHGNEKKRVTFVTGIIKPLKDNVPQKFKCKPFIIFRGKTSRTLSGIEATNRNDPNLLLRYQEKAWMNTPLYVDYLKHIYRMSLPMDIAWMVCPRSTKF